MNYKLKQKDMKTFCNDKEEKLTTINVEDVPLPNLLYKYRCFSKEFDKTIISNNEVYFASPSSFIDSLDCKIPYRIDLLHQKDLLKLFEFHSKENEARQNWKREQHRQFARDSIKSTSVKNIMNDFNRLTFEKNDKHWGILSLTEYFDSNKMWEDYSSNHTGFCVGIDPKVLILNCGTINKVDYKKELPPIFPHPIHSHIHQMSIQIFTKLEKWEFEQEYRTGKNNNTPFTQEERKVKLPPEAFLEIILGVNASDENTDWVKNEAKKFPLVKIKKMTNTGDKIDI